MGNLFHPPPPQSTQSSSGFLGRGPFPLPLFAISPSLLAQSFSFSPRPKLIPRTSASEVEHLIHL